ncbi:MAG: hypothetical protein LBU22_05670 [Dysgonamonadaceae bacterium]|jgi:hypothetical protein|nr:hypothetical protein [Dysgonamonadaceae bacterium]
MEKDFNKKLINAVLSNMPPKVKAASYLSDVLKLSRESVYRRIRGEIPFTIDEFAKLSVALGFSFDEIIGNANFGHAFFEFFANEKPPNEMYATMLEKYLELLEKIETTQMVDSVMSINRIPPNFYMLFDNLHKFVFYKWLNQYSGVPSNLHFSDIDVPPEIMSLQKRIRFNFSKLKRRTLILDPNTFLNQVKEIQYYYKMKLLNDEDLSLLKQEMNELVGLLENAAKTGTLGAYKTKTDIYLSFLSISANTCYYAYDDKVRTIIWIFIVNPIIIHNTNISDMQKKWLNFLKRQSTLISQSNEISQTEFFNQQRKYIEML